MAIHITEPVGTYLPGKDDNIYEFYGDSSATNSYIYTVKVNINDTDEYILKYNGLSPTIPIQINVKNLLKPIFDKLTPNTEQANLMDAIPCIKVVLKVSGAATGAVESEVTSAIRYYWNGCSKDYWDEVYSYNTILNYVPLGSGLTERAQWVGPTRPTGRNNIPNAGGKLPQQALKEAYVITPDTKCTATAVVCHNGDLGIDEDPWATNYNVYVYNKNGNMTKWIQGNIPIPRISDYTNKFNSFVVGIEQINTLIAGGTLNSLVYDLSASQYIEPGKDYYYQVFLSGTMSGDQVSSVPLTFEICNYTHLRVPTLDYDLNHVSLLYYSKLGGWWEIPAHKYNFKESSIKNTTMESERLNKNIFSRDKHVVGTIAEDIITLNTAWITTGGERFEIEDFIQSPEIYIISGGVYVPVVLQDSSYITNTSNDRNLISYTFKFNSAYNKNTIL